MKYSPNATERQCQQCRTTFISRRPNHRYCSDRCTNAASRARRPGRPQNPRRFYMRRCRRCAVTFASFRDTARHCSPTCAKAMQQARRRMRGLSSDRPVARPIRYPDGPLPPRSCVSCGQAYRPRITRQRYCSALCRSRADGKVANRRRRGLGRLVGRDARRFVFDRDRFICWLCGRSTDPTAPRYAASLPSLDHVVPLSLGGEHTIENLRCAHLGCNRSRGNRKCPDDTPRPGTREPNSRVSHNAAGMEPFA